MTASSKRRRPRIPDVNAAVHGGPLRAHPGLLRETLAGAWPVAQPGTRGDDWRLQGATQAMRVQSLRFSTKPWAADFLECGKTPVDLCRLGMRIIKGEANLTGKVKQEVKS
jgi:hypothetical protein